MLNCSSCRVQASSQCCSHCDKYFKLQKQEFEFLTRTIEANSVRFPDMIYSSKKTPIDLSIGLLSKTVKTIKNH